ncbi:hypothetical protein L226DRAFT_613737 [Lentinus tigrinus ALCF2SS1-7]|uniref:Uncharacterized protein n=1 Tax=Lentinus tigrinus ALCF2SS1-6 TaxID=1328759 RepID=A0A5C2RYL9_9APHY|nr:hypothetical protein L227DRAFT_656458 [Lentinus tigrinus ALCF2SS1-6]RPD73953.1 hypothetical protein L226DRAFT_613737 [Lentinus tigrinus ALCF2SS1-7]
MDSILGTLVYFDDETEEYVCNTNYRPVAYNPYPFVASRFSSPSEKLKTASFLDLEINLRKGPQDSEVPSQGKDGGLKAEGIFPMLSVAYTPASWLSEQDWFDGADAPTDVVNVSDIYRDERKIEGGSSAPATLAEGSRSVRPGTESAPLEERYEEQEKLEGCRSASTGVESAALAEGSCSGPSGAQSAYLEERLKVAQRLEMVGESWNMWAMSSLKDVDMTDALARINTSRTRSPTSVGRRSFLKRSRTDETQPDPSVRRVRWCPSIDALPTPTHTRGGQLQRLCSPRPPQRWDQLVHGVAKLKVAFSDVVVKSQSSHAM